MVALFAAWLPLLLPAGCSQRKPRRRLYGDVTFICCSVFLICLPSLAFILLKIYAELLIVKSRTQIRVYFSAT